MDTGVRAARTGRCPYHRYPQETSAAHPGVTQHNSTPILATTADSHSTTADTQCTASRICRVHSLANPIVSSHYTLYQHHSPPSAAYLADPSTYTPTSTCISLNAHVIGPMPSCVQLRYRGDKCSYFCAATWCVDDGQSCEAWMLCNDRWDVALCISFYPRRRAVTDF